MKKQLRNSILKIHPVSYDTLDSFVDLWTEHRGNQKEIITEEGKTERYLYFITEGSQKAYFLDDGKEHMVGF